MIISSNIILEHKNWSVCDVAKLQVDYFNMFYPGFNRYKGYYTIE